MTQEWCVTDDLVDAHTVETILSIASRQSKKFTSCKVHDRATGTTSLNVERRRSFRLGVTLSELPPSFETALRAHGYVPTKAWTIVTYEPGGFFKRHKDGSPQKGLYKAVVYLTSVRLEDGGETVVYDDQKFIYEAVQAKKGRALVFNPNAVPHAANVTRVRKSILTGYVSKLSE